MTSDCDKRATCRKQQVGIYGGTFSPPHTGHIRAAKAFLKEAALDRLLIMPACIPPHKPAASVSPMHRMAMAQLAFSSLPGYGSRITVSDYEINRETVSYTAHTLRYFAQGDCELYFLCGTDMFLTMDSWYHPEEIFSLATVAYMRRERSSEYDQLLHDARRRYETAYHARLLEIVCPPIEVSSTQLRVLLAEKRDPGTLLPDSVKDYIKEHQLYRD